jgi:TolB-like protein
MVKRWLMLSNLLLLSFFSLPAQQKQPLLAVLPFTSVQDLQNECLQLEKLVQSYITELNLFKLVAIQDRDLNHAYEDITETLKLGSQVSVDYLLQGTLGTLGSSYVLTLEFIKVQSGEKTSFSSIEPSLDMLSSNLKVLLFKTLMQQVDAINNIGNEVSKEIESENEILGTWRGDKGIELVRLFPGGTGQAILTSGARMDLKYSIQNGTLMVYQISQNNERYYHPLPYKVALQLVSLAKPMRWIFTELSNTSVLRGKKISTAVRYDQDQLLEVIHDSERDAEWVRTGN